MKSMDFFVWQGHSREFEQHAARRRSGIGLQASVRAASAGGVNSLSIHDECNAARRKKTRFHGAFMGWDWYKVMALTSHGQAPP
jgi:hypothetical protein